MTAWVLVGVGATAAALATTVSVGTAALGRLDLTRWIARRLRGAAVASTRLVRPGQARRGAAAIGSVGALVAGVGCAAVFAHQSPMGWLMTVGFGVIPLFVVGVYGVPRAIGQRWSEAVVLRLGPWIERLVAPLGPFVPGMNRDDVPDWREMLRVGTAEDILSPHEVRVITGVIDFTRRTVRDVMTPRAAVVAVAEGAGRREIVERVSESGFSRLPVYRASVDHIVGIVYAFDLLKTAPAGEVAVREIPAVPATKSCADVWFELQATRRQMAVVLDEYGGTAGVVTESDLLGVLVHALFAAAPGDEASGPDVSDVLEIDGGTTSTAVGARFGVVLPDGSMSIAGMLARAAGRIPQAGDRFTLSGLEFDVLSATPTRVERLAVRRGPVRAEPLPRADPR